MVRVWAKRSWRECVEKHLSLPPLQGCVWSPGINNYPCKTLKAKTVNSFSFLPPLLQQITTQAFRSQQTKEPASSGKSEFLYTFRLHGFLASCGHRLSATSFPFFHQKVMILTDKKAGSQTGNRTDSKAPGEHPGRIEWQAAPSMERL